MRCDYYDAGECRSCALLPTAYDAQLAAKTTRSHEALAGHAPVWLPPVASATSGFRNKAKMVVAGTRAEPTLGILDPVGGGVDLRHCPLYGEPVHAVLPLLAELVGRAGLTPYDVPGRTGDLKHVLVTQAPDDQLMVRLVLRTAVPVDAIRAELPWLLAAEPRIRVFSVNLQPVHQAILEGPDEIVLSVDDALTMRLGGIDLLLRPGGFFQTNTAVATQLYQQVGDWIAELAPSSVLDLYCGVGGFALHAAAPGRHVVGVEVSPEAVASAREASARAGVEVEFRCADATEATEVAAYDVVVVNPPRRGLGAELCSRLEAAGACGAIVYSSCNVDSLARDLAALPSWRVSRAQVLDMFPHTGHFELLTLLERRA